MSSTLAARGESCRFAGHFETFKLDDNRIFATGQVLESVIALVVREGPCKECAALFELHFNTAVGSAVWYQDRSADAEALRTRKQAECQ